MLRRERDEIVSLEEVKDTHPKEFSDNANVISKIKTILQMDAFSVMVSHVENIIGIYFELLGSLRDKVDKTRNSILLASRYFCTALMILTAQYLAS
jgi:hypothetical protein